MPLKPFKALEKSRAYFCNELLRNVSFNVKAVSDTDFNVMQYMQKFNLLQIIEQAGIPKCDELNDIKELLDKFGKLCKKRPILYQHYIMKRNNYSIELLRKMIEKYEHILTD